MQVETEPPLLYLKSRTNSVILWPEHQMPRLRPHYSYWQIDYTLNNQFYARLYLLRFERAMDSFENFFFN